MKDFLKTVDEAPRIVKVILCLPVLDIVWAIYRIGGAILKKNWFHLVLAILWIFFGGTVGWILDLIWILVFRRIFWFKD